MWEIWLARQGQLYKPVQTWAWLSLNCDWRGKLENLRLREDNLLKKCLHGKTLNQNKSLNGMVWQIIPEEVYVGRNTLQLGVYGAVDHFNIGLSQHFQAPGMSTQTLNYYSKSEDKQTAVIKIPMVLFRTTSSMKINDQHCLSFILAKVSV